MIRATVVGQTWAARKAAGLDGQRLLLLAVAGSDRLVVGVDTLDARVGDRVLVAWGSGARNVLAAGPHNRERLCDAAVALVIDGCSDDPAPAAGPQEGR